MNYLLTALAFLSSNFISQVSAKSVFAHVVVGDAQVLTQNDWENDMKLAQASGIDAFVMNVGNDPTDPANLARAYAAAEAVGFKLFMSFDMSHFGNIVGITTNMINNYIKPFQSSPAQLFQGSRLFISTFGGDFQGQFLEQNSNINQAWTNLKNQAGIPIFFVPSWSSLDGNVAVTDNPVVDGIMQWQSWPQSDTAPDISRDIAYQADAKRNGKVYMAPHSPWFFRHLQPDTGDNFIYKSEQWLFAWRWEQLINMTTQPDFVELQTWNDFGESHYIGPIDVDANLPTGTVDADEYSNSNYPHSALLGLNLFYANWYKTGSVPAITEDEFYWWYRPQLANTSASNDPLGQPLNFQWAEDWVYLIALVPQGSQAKSVQFTLDGFVQGSQPILPNTVNKFKVPLSIPGSVNVKILTASNQVLYSQDGPAINGSPTLYNYNYWAGSFTGTSTSSGSAPPSGSTDLTNAACTPQGFNPGSGPNGVDCANLWPEVASRTDALWIEPGTALGLTSGSCTVQFCNFGSQTITYSYAKLSSVGEAIDAEFINSSSGDSLAQCIFSTGIYVQVQNSVGLPNGGSYSLAGKQFC